VRFNDALVKAFVDAGVPVFTGTDTTVSGIPAGSSLHDEFEALARAGMSNAAILTATTRQAAEWLGVDQDRGTIEAGKRADLVLLDADPLADVANTRRIAAVITSGRYLPRKTLDAQMQALARRYRGAAR
jgi:imidazolonepropionase-like amidohydrolase